MANKFVLVTGSTGFIGIEVLKVLLETGHRVRITTRSQSKGNSVKKAFEKYASQIEVSLVEDQLKPGSYDIAAQGVDAIIHVASPFDPTAKNAEEDLIKPAIRMTENILKAAALSNSVKRVAITSSCAAVIDGSSGNPFANQHYTDQDWNPITREQGQGPMGYVASKKLAEQTAWEFIASEKPRFDLVTLCPTLVLGPPLQEVKSMDSLNASCKYIYALFDCKELPENHIPFMVSLKDVAKAHVRAIDVEAAGGKRVLLNGDVCSFQLIIDAMREKYPQIQTRTMEGKPGKPEYQTPLATFDCSIAKDVLGINFQNWEQCIIDETVPALLDLEKRLE